MDRLTRLFAILVAGLSSVAWGGQDLAPDFTPLNGNWELAGGPQIDKVRILGILLRVDGDKIFGSMDFDVLCRRTDGGRSGSGRELSVQGDIAPDGSFSFTNEYPHPPPAHVISVRGVVPAVNADEWSGSFSISEFEDDHDLHCPAASGYFVAKRSEQASGVYSGEVKVEGTAETAWVTLELSPGGLIKWKGANPPFDRVIGIDAKVTVSATMFFNGGTFSTGSPPHQLISQMQAGAFTAHFPDSLTVGGIFNPWHNNQVHIHIWLRHDYKREPRWEASGDVTRQ